MRSNCVMSDQLTSKGSSDIEKESPMVKMSGCCCLGETERGGGSQASN